MVFGAALQQEFWIGGAVMFVIGLVLMIPDSVLMIINYIKEKFNESGKRHTE